MARRLTKSPPFRISLVQWERLNTRAATAGQTVGEYIGQLVATHLGPEPGVGPDNAPCDHPRSKVSLIGGGLAKCGCGAIRGMNGRWK